MKKLLSILAAVTLLVSLAACGNNAGTPSSTEDSPNDVQTIGNDYITANSDIVGCI